MIFERRKQDIKEFIGITDRPWRRDMPLELTGMEQSQSKGCIKAGDVKRTHTYDVVVGILSAQGNFNLRESLRKTWVGYAQKHHMLSQRILVKFIVSNQACMIPPEYRADPYKCEPRVLHGLEFDKKLVAYKMPLYIQDNHFSSGLVGRDFSVLYPIVITDLGISTSGLTKLKGNATTVRLYDKISKKEIVNVTFTVDSPGTLINGSWFKSVLNFVLPKDFQASIVSENFSYDNHVCHQLDGSVEVEDRKGPILLLKVQRFDNKPGIFPEQEETILDERCPYSAGTFLYRAHVSDQSNLPSGLKKDLRYKEWENLKDTENIRLRKEAREYGDVLLVPNVDIYRNLPSQLLEFYQWVSKNISFTFTLKTDDDCFVDLEGILQVIDDNDLKSKAKVWWSRFRTDWLLDHQGKWAEPDYPGVTYPTFACGAGNVLSADLVHWLARNADSLKRYQGEDVSVGIWLSAVGPTIYKDHRWSCFQECFPGMFTSPEQDTESLLEMWENVQSCGNPCSC